MSKGNELKFQRGAAANTEFEDRNKGAENCHHDRDGTAGSPKSPVRSQPCGDLSTDSRASALALAAAGAQVLVHYGRGAKEADGVVAEIRKAGGRADAIATDLAAADAPQACEAGRSIIGDRLDILVANAGISKAASIEETTVEDFDKLFAVNVRAPYFLVQQLLPYSATAAA